MVDKKSVNVNWQTVFALIPIIDLWAAYRIEKFRLYFFIFWVGSVIVQTFVTYAMLGKAFWNDEGWFFSSDPTVASVEIAMMIVAAGLQMYFLRKWSKDWNAKLLSPT